MAASPSQASQLLRNYGPAPGAIRFDDQTVEWRVWSPQSDSVKLIRYLPEGEVAVEMRDEDGWWLARAPGVLSGERYRFRIPTGDFADPATRWQPEGVFGPSAVFFPEKFQWSSLDWKGIERKDLLIYEVHIGTFTQAGTFAGAIERLADLKELGITAIEVMPIGQFSGERNWGYDGVFPYAVQNSYGGPQAFQEFIDAAHNAGLAVLLDVVYNHFGPEGNVLGQFAPYYNPDKQTPWGAAINFDGPDCEAVRGYVLHNVAMWLRDFRLDGLRLDAVHAISDSRSPHLLSEIKAVAEQIAQEQGRKIHIIAESETTDPRIVDPVVEDGIGLDGVWADQFHHCIRSLLAGDHTGYFAAYGTLGQLAEAYQDVYVSRDSEKSTAGDRDRSRFVVCIHNHDQIGNRAQGDRSPTYLSPAVQRLACGLLMVSPCTPMLFMGEDYAETRPFPYFCSFQDSDLIAAVRNGRRSEFEALGFQWGTEIPDPQEPQTFHSAKLSWNWPTESHHAQMRRLYRDLIQARRTWRELQDRRAPRAHSIVTQKHEKHEEGLLILQHGDDPELMIIANLSPRAEPLPESILNTYLLQSTLPRFSTEQRIYGGTRDLTHQVHSIEPFELLIFGTIHDRTEDAE